VTAARTADVFVEVAAAASTRVRTADHFAETVATPTTKARTGDVYIELVVGGGRWRVHAQIIG
jgi:hypothetical protein